MMIGTGTRLSITSTPAAAARSFRGEFESSFAPFFWQRLKERNRYKVIFGCPARTSPFSHYTAGEKKEKKKKQQRGKEHAERGLRRNLCLFYLATRSSVYVQPITLSRLSQTDDVSNWKAWKTLERQPASCRNQPYFYLPRLAPKWRGGARGRRGRGGKKEERIGACFFGKGTKELPSVGPGQFFACFMALSLPQSFLDGPGVKSEDRYMGDPCQDVRGRLAVLFCFF